MPRKLSASVALPPAPVRVPSRRPSDEGCVTSYGFEWGPLPSNDVSGIPPNVKNREGRKGPEIVESPLVLLIHRTSKRHLLFSLLNHLSYAFFKLGPSKQIFCVKSKSPSLRIRPHCITFFWFVNNFSSLHQAPPGRDRGENTSLFDTTLCLNWFREFPTLCTTWHVQSVYHYFIRWSIFFIFGFHILKVISVSIPFHTIKSLHKIDDV